MEDAIDLENLKTLESFIFGALPIKIIVGFLSLLSPFYCCDFLYKRKQLHDFQWFILIFNNYVEWLRAYRLIEIIEINPYA